MEKEAIAAKVADLIAEMLYPAAREEIKPEAHLEADLGIDSVDRLSLTLSLEDHFGIEITDDQLAGFHRVADILAHLEKIFLPVPSPSTTE